MQLICALFGHQPTPLRTRRRAGRLHNRCVLCRQPLERLPAARTWRVADEAGDAAGQAGAG